MSIINELIAEGRRRHVFRAAGLYAAAAFIVLQLADILMPAFEIPDVVISYLLVAIAAGFPIVLALTWVLDVTPDGIKVTPGLSRDERAQLAPGKLMDIVIIIVALGVGFLYLERFFKDDEAVRVTEVAEPVVPEEPVQVTQELEPSIAVLPFDNLSTSDDNAIFAAGIHEDILNYLSRNPELLVTSRKSTLSYQDSDVAMRQIATDLNVNYLMEGSVRREGDQVRITVQLIQARDDIHLWSETYNRDVNNVFMVQDEVAQQVAEKLRVQFELFNEGRPTSDLKAYELFLEARELYGRFNAMDTRLSVTRYREALQMDPRFANAWAGLALAASSPQSNEDLDEARNAAEQALALNPDSWLSNWAMASYLANWRVERFPEAEPFFVKAIKGNPNEAQLRWNYGFALWQNGRSQEAGDQFMESFRRNPLSGEANIARAYAAIFDNRRDLAVRHIQRALELEPGRPFLNWWAGMAYNLMDDSVSTARSFRTALSLNAEHLPSLVWLAQLFGNLGDPHTADYWLTRAEEIDPYNSNTLAQRHDNLIDRGLLNEAIQLIQDWNAREPENTQARRVSGFLPSHRSHLAWQQEDHQGFMEQRRLGLEIQLHYLESAKSDGDYQVTFWNSWTFLSAAISARTLGDDKMADDFYTKVINYWNEQPPGSNISDQLQLAIANAGLGNREQAAENFAAAVQESPLTRRYLTLFRVPDDPYGVYNDIHRDIAFIDAMARMKEREDGILTALRVSYPDLFPPD